MLKNFNICVNHNDNQEPEYTFNITVNESAEYTALTALFFDFLQNLHIPQPPAPKSSLEVDGVQMDFYETYGEIVCDSCGEKFVVCPEEMDDESILPCECGAEIVCKKI